MRGLPDGALGRSVHLVTEHRDDYDTEFAAPAITKLCWSYSRGAITGTTGISRSRMSTDGAAGGVPDEATISAVLTAGREQTLLGKTASRLPRLACPGESARGRVRTAPWRAPGLRRLRSAARQLPVGDHRALLGRQSGHAVGRYLLLCPRCSALSLMCSYWRSRFGLDPLGISATSRHRRSNAAADASTQVTLGPFRGAGEL